MSYFRRALFTTTAATTTLYTGACFVDPYQTPLRKILAKLDPEQAHNLAIGLAKWNLLRPRLFGLLEKSDPESLGSKVWGLPFRNPVGLAAGLDKHAEGMTGLFGVGFGFVEVGSVTPKPQNGNDKPRVFRLEEDRAVINRYGFNSHGAQVVRERVYRWDYGGGNTHRMGVLGVNLGKNKDTKEKDAVEDYVKGVRAFGELAEYLVVNVSSPNTKGLRDLQRGDVLRGLLKRVLEERDSLVYRPPVLVKIAPDIDSMALKDIVEVVVGLGVDGMIVCNTTVERNQLGSVHKEEKGGVSGRPLKDRATELIGDVYRMTQGKIPIVGVGGVETGKDAYEKIRKGASLVQLYTVLAYEGPWVVDRIKQELVECLKRDGFDNVEQAIGVDHEDIVRGRVSAAETINGVGERESVQ